MAKQGNKYGKLGLSNDQLDRMLFLAREAFDYTFGQGEVDVDRIQLDDDRNMCIDYGGRRVTIDGKHFNKLKVDSMKINVLEIFRDMMGDVADFRNSPRTRSRSDSTAGNDKMTDEYFEQRGIHRKQFENTFVVSETKGGLQDDEFAIEDDNDPIMITKGDKKKGGMNGGKGKNRYLEVPTKGGLQYDEPYHNNTKGEFVINDDNEPIMITEAANKLSVGKRYSSSYRRNNNNMYAASSSATLDEISESLHDNVDQLMDYVYQQDDLIANQSKQIAYLEREIINANQSRRRRYGRGGNGRYGYY